MKKLIIYPIFLLLVVSIAFAETLIMDVPAKASIGEQFQVLFVTDLTGDFGFLLNLDVISGSCIPDHQLGMIISPFTDAAFTVTAAQSAGDCIIEGRYRLGTIDTDTGWVVMPTQTITITGEACVPTAWSPGTSTVCSGVSFTQSDSCTTRSATGTKTIGCEDCSCGNWVNVACVGTAMKQIRTCSPSNCENEEQHVADATCEGVVTTPSKCEIWEETSDTGCKLAGWVYLVIGIVAVMIVLKSLPK